MLFHLQDRSWNETLRDSHVARLENHPHEWFQHKSLPPSSPESIRLVRVLPDSNSSLPIIRCSVQSHSLQSGIKYTCLSYQWHLSAYSENNHVILVNGKLFRIGKNLANFLQVARRHYTHLWLWIDALCIDQGNHNDRNEQVQRMGTIYQGAENVIAWFGKGQYNYAALAGNPSSYVAHSLQCRPLRYRSETVHDEASVLRTIETSDYWNRAWVVQEQYLARNVTLLVGEVEVVPWRITCMSKTYDSQKPDESPKLLPSHIPMAIFLNKRLHSPTTLWQSQPLLDLIKTHQHLQCHDPHDRVYALLSLSRECTSIKVDYALSRTSLFFRTLHACGSHSGPFCLCSTLHLFHALSLSTNADADLRDLLNSQDFNIHDRLRVSSRLRLHILIAGPISHRQSNIPEDKPIPKFIRVGCRCPASSLPPHWSEMKGLVYCFKGVCQLQGQIHILFQVNDKAEIHATELFRSGQILSVKDGSLPLDGISLETRVEKMSSKRSSRIIGHRGWRLILTPAALVVLLAKCSGSRMEKCEMGSSPCKFMCNEPVQ